MHVRIISVNEYKQMILLILEEFDLIFGDSLIIFISKSQSFLKLLSGHIRRRVGDCSEEAIRKFGTRRRTVQKRSYVDGEASAP